MPPNFQLTTDKSENFHVRIGQITSNMSKGVHRE